MRNAVLFCIAMLGLAGTTFGADGMLVEGATEAGVRNDCRVTAEMTVKLMKMRSAYSPDDLYAMALDQLEAGKYQGSFGDTEFVAGFYTGMALQMDKDVDQFMAQASAKDLAQMTDEHEINCLKSAISGLSKNPGGGHR